MKYNFKKLYVNRLALTFLVIITLITQSLVGITAYAAPIFTISPKYVNGYVSKRITITSSENSFTDNESTPYIMKNGSVVGLASISSINSSSNEVSFTLGSDYQMENMILE